MGVTVLLLARVIPQAPDEESAEAISGFKKTLHRPYDVTFGAGDARPLAIRGAMLAKEDIAVLRLEDAPKEGNYLSKAVLSKKEVVPASPLIVLGVGVRVISDFNPRSEVRRGEQGVGKVRVTASAENSVKFSVAPDPTRLVSSDSGSSLFSVNDNGLELSGILSSGDITGAFTPDLNPKKKLGDAPTNQVISMVKMSKWIEAAYKRLECELPEKGAVSPDAALKSLQADGNSPWTFELPSSKQTDQIVNQVRSHILNQPWEKVSDETLSALGGNIKPLEPNIDAIGFWKPINLPGGEKLILFSRNGSIVSGSIYYDKSGKGFLSLSHDRPMLKRLGKIRVPQLKTAFPSLNFNRADGDNLEVPVYQRPAQKTTFVVAPNLQIEQVRADSGGALLTLKVVPMADVVRKKLIEDPKSVLTDERKELTDAMVADAGAAKITYLDALPKKIVFSTFKDSKISWQVETKPDVNGYITITIPNSEKNNSLMISPSSSFETEETYSRYLPGIFNRIPH